MEEVKEEKREVDQSQRILGNYPNKNTQNQTSLTNHKEEAAKREIEKG